MAGESTRQQQLKEALQVKTDETTCDAVLARLEAYITAQLDGRDPFPLYPYIATHLDGCLSCAAAYGRLYHMILADQNEALPVLQHPRQLDLSFLPPLAAPSLVDRLRLAVEKLENGWRFRLSADLLPLLQPQAAPIPLRTSPTEERYSELLLALEPGAELRANMPFKVLVYRDAQVPTDCLVEVWVQPPDRTWPHLAGFTVTLQLPYQTHQQTTNPWGVATFPQIPINELETLSITMRDR